MGEELKGGIDLGSLGSFDFTPDWARKDAGVSIGKVRPERSGERSGSPDGRKPSGDRKPFVKRPFDRDRRDGGPRPRREFVRPLDAEIKILPETKALGTIIRRLQGDVHAYKLKDLAYFFLDNPSSVLMKVTPRREEDGAPSTVFHQCKACGFVSDREDEVVEHILRNHLGDYYDAKEIDCEPPKGNFNCVARCGLSGVLLGPPNIHEFNAVVKEMVRVRYPEMSEAEYRSRIEMVRDPETIEEWRKSAVKKTVFFVKGTADTEGAPQLSREQAEGEFRRTILPSLVDRPKNLMITADKAVESPVKALAFAARQALEAERRAPYAMCFALRGAFHHRKLKFFRVNDSRGQEFVTNTELKPFDAEHAIPELAAIARFVEEHPCCDLNELPQEGEAVKHLQWLVTTGHVVAFTNGVYSAVEKFPKYGPQWKKRKEAKKEEEKPAEVPAEQPNEANAVSAENEENR